MSASMDWMLRLTAQGRLRALDAQFADFVRRASGSDDFGLLAAAALASRAVGAGDVCLDLGAQAGQPFPGEAEASANGGAPGLPVLPPLDEWLTSLRTPAACRCVGAPEDGRPLVLDGQRLYLRRYWEYELRVARGLVDRAASGAAVAPLPAWFEERLRQYFPDDADEARDAARKACCRSLAILCGGPGTGKTHTLARVVALLAELQPSGTPLRVSLAAPTGKAAARVMESIRAAKRDLAAEAAIAQQVPEKATTLHRLLGSLPDSSYFRHDRRHPLEADVVVLDEASMVDLPLMAKLLDALPAAARLILVGDQDQLASVEPGRVFGDLCGAAATLPALTDCWARLTRSRRFGPESAIGRLSTTLHGGTPDEAWALLRNVGGPVIQHDSGVGLCDAQGHPRSAFRDAVMAGYAEFVASRTPEEALRSAAAFRVLCALRRGPFGVETVNRTTERILASAGGFAPTGAFYDHRLILVTVNDAALGLFNGDVGVVLAEPGCDRLQAWFEGETDAAGMRCRAVPVNLLPEHETAFAMTVHKSQGSEFQRVALLLPPDADSPVLTRELLYTGLTRTRGALDLWCTESSFKAAAAHRTRRTSGLLHALERAAPRSVALQNPPRA